MFAFTGQGSQYAGMGKELYQESAAFRDVLFTYQDMAQSQGLPSFIDLISEGLLDLASQSAVRIHLAIVALEIAVAHILGTWGLRPDMVIGHSLGEYAALCVSGVLGVSDTLHLVGQRALLIERKLTPGAFAMLAVRKNVQELREFLKSKNLVSCEIACMNAPNATVASGTLSDIANLQGQLEAEGTRASVLRIPYGFHSKQIEPIMEEFEEIAKGAVFSAPLIPVASTLTGNIVRDESTFSSSYLVRQAREPVNFLGALQACRAAGFASDRHLWIEVGPEPICSGLIRATLDTASDRLLATLRPNENNWKTISFALAAAYHLGTSVNWPEYHKDFKKCLTLLDLPTYAFDEKDFWTSYVEPERTSSVADLKKKLSEPPTNSFVPGFPTPSLQRVENENIDGKKISVTFASHTSDPNLFAAIEGHVVDEITVCPLSVFCDMALSASNYVYSKLKPREPVPVMSIRKIELVHPLVVPEIDPKQIAKVTASYKSEDSTVAISFHSDHGKTHHEHGACHVVFGDSDEWKAQLSQTLFLLGTRINSLRDLATTGKAHRLLKRVVYKLFANLVAYGDNYQALEEVILDSECRDAIGTVKLPAATGSGQFLFNPYWMDSTVHLAGFLLNGSLKYPDDIACLSTGFDSWRIFEELSAEKSYTSYVSMQETGKNSMLVGDCYVFDGSKLVLATMGIKFQKMKKVVLNSILLPGTLGSKHAGKVQIPQAKSLTPNQSVAKPSDSIESQERAPTAATHSPAGRSSSPSSISESDLDKGTSTPGSSIGNTDIDMVNELLSVVAAESGYKIEDMSDDTVFADMGVDSLMSITISATLKRDTGVELPGTFFIDNPTLGEAKAALGVGSDVDQAEPIDIIASLKPSTLTALSEADSGSKYELVTPPEKDLSVPPPSSPVEAEPSSQVILLQGNHSSEALKMFLLPDGSGSLTSYMQLPSLGLNTCIYGVESAFVKEPSKHVYNCDEIVGHFVAAIRGKQSNGPYLLGGISFGALHAYEVARKLLEAGEQVQGLLLMDMAVPKAVDTNAQSVMHQLEEAGLIPPLIRQTRTQKEHLESTVRAFLNYEPIPMSIERQPKKTVLISARSHKMIQWLFEESTTKGWGDLVGEVQCQGIEADHLALLRYPTVSLIQAF